MISRILFTIFCLAFYFLATPGGMANNAIQEEVRADFFVDERFDEAVLTEDEVGFEFGNDDEKKAVKSFNDFGLIQFSEGEVESESSVDNENDGKREVKRVPHYRFFVNKCRDFGFLSAKKLSRGMAKHPESQDARQELTAMIRCLIPEKVNTKV